MKAGIYRTPNGNLVYVAKDRTVKATNLQPSSWPGTKVSHRSKDDTVLLGDYRCTRWADVPNGCTDPHKAMQDAIDKNDAEIKQALGLPEDLKTGESMADWALRKAAEANNTPDAVTAEGGAADFKTAEQARKIAHAELLLAAIPRRYFTLPSALSAPYTERKLAEWREKTATQLREQGFRLCRAASARKHRRKGDLVIGLGDGRHAWRSQDHKHGTLQDCMKRFVQP